MINNLQLLNFPTNEKIEIQKEGQDYNENYSPLSSQYEVEYDDQDPSFKSPRDIFYNDKPLDYKEKIPSFFKSLNKN